VCSKVFPDLATMYREALNILDRRPLIVGVPPWLHRPDDLAPLTAIGFQTLVGNLMYVATAYPRLPRLIETVHRHSAQGVGAMVASELAVAATLNRATQAAVECRDRPRYRTAPASASTALEGMQIYGICDDWSEL